MLLYDYKMDEFKHLDNAIRVYITDPTDNGIILSISNRELISDWCKENCQGAFWIGMGFGQFELEQDALLFRLTWNQRLK